MAKDAKPEYTETYTLVEYLEKRYDFENERHESGGLVLSAPNVEMKALIQRGHKLLNAQEVCEILEAFGFSPAQVKAIKANLIGYKPGLFKKSEIAIKILETTPHKRHPISEEARQWEEDFFRKLHEDYEKNAVKTTPPGGIIYNYQNLEGIGLMADKPATICRRDNAPANAHERGRGDAMTNYLKSPGILTHALAEYLEKRYGFKRALQENGMLIGAPDFSRKALIPRGRLLLNESEVCEALTDLEFKPSEIDSIKADIAHYNPEPVRDWGYGTWLLDSVPPNKKRKMSEENARWMEDFFKKLDAEDAPSGGRDL